MNLHVSNKSARNEATTLVLCCQFCSVEFATLTRFSGVIPVFKLTTSNAETNAWFVAVKSGSVERVKELLESGVATLEVSFRVRMLKRSTGGLDH